MPAPLPIKSINHVARETTDVERSIAFYRDVLGFRPVWRPNFSFDGAWLFNYGVQIHIIAGEPPQRSGEITTRGDHLALHADDIEAAERLLGEHGIPFRKIVQASTGVEQLFFQDPDGNHIEVGKYGPVRED